MTGAAATAFPILLSAAPVARPDVVVSVHDVAPSTRAEVAEIVTQVARQGVNVCSLLVVPDYHHRGESMRDGEFVRWLQDLERAGHEVVIHGFYHRREQPARESWISKLITRQYTRGEGEFFDIAYEEAFRRITKAREQFVAAGLTPRGFIAPAWLLSAAGEKAAADAGMEYTTRLSTVRDLRTGTDFRSQSLVYSVRSSLRRLTSLGWNAALSFALTGAPLVRLGIHPADTRHPAVWNQILTIAGHLAAQRAPTTYRDWIGEQRVRAAGAS